MIVPTLVIHGVHSDLLSLASIQKMHHQNPQTEVLTVKDAGHSPYLYREEHFSNELHSFKYLTRGKKIMNSGSRVIGAIILALGIATSGHYIGSGIKFSAILIARLRLKVWRNKMLKSDLATWSINFSVSGDDLKALYQQVSLNKTVSQFLATNGFAVKISNGTISVVIIGQINCSNTNAKFRIVSN